MLIISSRKNFNDPDKLRPHGHKFKEIDFRTDLPIRDLKEDEFLNEVSGKSNQLAELSEHYEISNIRGEGLLIAFDLLQTHGADLVNHCLKKVS